MMKRELTVKQRRLNRLLGRDWYEVYREAWEAGQTQVQIAKRFTEIEGVPVAHNTLSGWAAKRRNESE